MKMNIKTGTMKTIEVTDEMYKFLEELSTELNTQNHRCTAMPYFYQVQTKKEVLAADNSGDIIWIKDEHRIETDDEIKEQIFAIRNWDFNDDSNNEEYEELDDWDKEDILEENGFTKYYITFENEYKNAFLTEKACKEHIKLNEHHYNEPADYLMHAFRNPELEKLMEFICGITNGKLHK